jgi:ubiquinone/menaquinone biosynthesis C-methylase UbiE
MKTKQSVSRFLKRFGHRQVPVWYESSRSVARQFDTVGEHLRILKVIPNPFPLYDLIMGLYERWSNRAALRGPVLERVECILDVGSGTGHLLSQIVGRTRKSQTIVAVDLSSQMLRNSTAYLEKHGLLSSRVCFEQADCMRLPHPAGAFDLYVSSYLFDLLTESELDMAIREMERLLAPDGHAILITMTTELKDTIMPVRLFYRLMNELYCLGYTNGRWNKIWEFLFAGYAPHCRPIALGRYLHRFPRLRIEYTKLSQVTLFPVRIYYVRKTHS